MDEDYGSQLTAETPATIDINFILDDVHVNSMVRVIVGSTLSAHKSGTNMPIATKSAEIIKGIATSLLIRVLSNPDIIYVLSHKDNLTVWK